MSFGVGTHGKLLDISRPLFEKYAERHGYDLLIPDNILDDRPPSWQKVRVLKYYLHDYDMLLWIDCDVVIADGSKDIADEFEPGFMQAVVRHYTQDGEVPNFGVWILRNTKKTFDWLDLLWKQEHHIFSGWWEQSAALELMGYAQHRRPCALREPSGWYHVTQFLPLEWNSHPWCKAENPRFDHVTMYPLREISMQEKASKAKWHEQP